MNEINKQEHGSHTSEGKGGTLVPAVFHCPLALRASSLIDHISFSSFTVALFPNSCCETVTEEREGSVASGRLGPLRSFLCQNPPKYGHIDVTCKFSSCVGFSNSLCSRQETVEQIVAALASSRHIIRFLYGSAHAVGGAKRSKQPLSSGNIRQSL